MEETWTPGPKLVEEAIFREVYYHPQLVMSNFYSNPSKSDKHAIQKIRTLSDPDFCLTKYNYEL